MTPRHREWLGSVRRAIRKALLDLEFERFDTAFLDLRELFFTEAPISDDTMEVKNLIASLATARPQLMQNAAARAAAVRRLEETKKYITEAMLSASDRYPPR